MSLIYLQEIINNVVSTTYFYWRPIISSPYTSSWMSSPWNLAILKIFLKRMQYHLHCFSNVIILQVLIWPYVCQVHETQLYLKDHPRVLDIEFIELYHLEAEPIGQRDSFKILSKRNMNVESLTRLFQNIRCSWYLIMFSRLIPTNNTLKAEIRKEVTDIVA